MEQDSLEKSNEPIDFEAAKMTTMYIGLADLMGVKLKRTYNEIYKDFHERRIIALFSNTPNKEATFIRTSLLSDEWPPEALSEAERQIERFFGPDQQAVPREDNQPGTGEPTL